MDKDNNLRDRMRITGAQKAAIVILSLTEENAARIFSLLSEEEIREVSHAMSHLGTIGHDMVENVLEDFSKDITATGNFSGNFHNTKNLLEKVLDPKHVEMLMEEIQGPQGKNTWEKLNNVNEDILALYLRNEHPQTAALVISKISPDHAAKVIVNLPEEFALEVMMRMMNMDSVKKEVLDRVERILRSEFISSLTKTQKRDSFELMADIFNNFDRNSESKYMQLLESKNAELANKIKDLMFTFDDIIKIDSKGIQVILRTVDKTKLTLAIKGANDQIKELILSNMSQRAAKIVQDEIEALGPVKVKDVDEAQSEIIKVAKDLIAKGEIEVSEDGNDQYI